MNKQERHEARIAKMAAFEESGVAKHDAQIFGLPFSVEESEVILIPVPWEVTVSFRPGTANGPEAIREASKQVDLYDPATPDVWKYGFAMKKRDTYIENKASRLRSIALECIHHQEHRELLSHPDIMNSKLSAVNGGGAFLNGYIYNQSLHYLHEDKIIGVVGGDHSVPLGLMQALAKHYGSYSILHIDAHYDHRDAYEGFEFSHASIMRNASRIPEIKKFVHVGIRDYCKEEAEFVAQSPDRFIAFTDRDIADKAFGGVVDSHLSHISWYHQCQKIIECLPKLVYISFDIDGLDPTLCPDTGTPVPGGLTFQQICFLLEQLARSKRTIIGFDLCEITPAPDCKDLAADWNANVGSRILYRLCSLAATSVFGHWHD